MLPKDMQITAIEANKAHNCAYERGLAGAIRAEQAVRRTTRYSDCQAIKGSQTSKRLDEISGIYSIYAPPLLFMMMKMIDAMAAIRSAPAQSEVRLC